MDKNKIVLVIGVMLFLGTSCYAGHYGDMEWADMWWKGDDAYDQSIDSCWNEPINWFNHVGDYDMVIPGPNEIVNLNFGEATHPPIIDNNNVGVDRAECNDLWLPDWQIDASKPVTLLMVGGELYIHKDFVIGRDGNDSATRPPKSIVTNPRLNTPDWAIDFTSTGPKNANAAGITMLPPNTTSANSLVAEAVSPESTTSSPLER